MSVDPFQASTLLFGGLIILVTVLEYNKVVPGTLGNTATLDYRLASLIKVLERGLSVLFIAYAVIISGARGQDNFSMYRNFIWLVVLLSVGLYVLRQDVPAETDPNGWDLVRSGVAEPLAIGSLFAIPVAYFAMR